MIVGATVTVRMKLCVVVPAELLAARVIGKLPLTVGVPARVAVPLPLSTKVTPAGRVPFSVSDGSACPVVVTENEPAALRVKLRRRRRW